MRVGAQTATRSVDHHHDRRGHGPAADRSGGNMGISRTRRRVALGGIVGLALAATIGTSGAALAQDPSPVTGGTLIVAADGTAFPANLNPAIATSNGVTYISSKVVEYLADAGYDGLVPRLATSW